MALPKNKSSTDHSENLFKEMVDLETILVVIIGRTGKVLPPIPKELSEDTLEIGIRFLPD